MSDNKIQDEMKEKRKLRKMPKGYKGNWLSGVCAGVAYYLDLPVWLVRVFVVLIGIELNFLVLIIYLIMAYSMKEYPEVPADIDD